MIMKYKLKELFKTIIQFIKETYQWYRNYIPVMKSVRQLKKDLHRIEKTDPEQAKRIKKALK